MVRRRSPVQARPTAFNIFMGKLFFLIFFTCFFSNGFLFSDVILSDTSGEVKIRKTPLGEWEELKEKNLKLSDGFAVRTENGRAKIIIDKSVIWLKNNTAIEVESASKYLNAFGLVYGKIKVSVKAIGRKSRFSIKTLTAVCAITRADVMMESDLDGRLAVDVLFGEVDFSYLIPPKKGERNFIIPQGVSLKIIDVEKPYILSVITQEKEKEIISSWEPSIVEEDRMQNILYRENQKISLKKFIAYSDNLNSEISNFVYKEKESDFEAARTLRDINGNLVRVDQRILRPDSRTVQFFNIIKRKDYKPYNYLTNFSYGQTGFKYNGEGYKDRIDLFVATFNFNKDIPKNVGEWQVFFDKSDVHPEWATFVSANLISRDNVFFVGEAYKYLETRGELINNTEVVGVPQNTNERDNDIILTGKIGKEYLNDIVMYNFKERDKDNPTGELARISDNNDINGALWGLKVSKQEIKDNNSFYQLNRIKYLKGANPSNEYFYLCQENYLISNDGKIRNKDDIVSSNKSVADIIKENAVQSVNYVKRDNNGAMDDDYIGSYNIDLVLIGDLPFSMFENTSRGVDRWKD
jgi:hypothetical protein